MIANSMTLETKARGKKCVFTLSTRDLEIATDKEKLPIELSVSDLKTKSSGTKITLSNLVQGLVFPNPDKLRQYCYRNMGGKRISRVM